MIGEASESLNRQFTIAERLIQAKAYTRENVSLSNDNTYLWNISSAI
jgi:hypothetical protein